MAKADDYAQWIVDNADKKGSDDFNTVVQAYQQAKAEESQTSNTPPTGAENATAQIPEIATGAARSLLNGTATQNTRDMLGIAKNVTQWTPNAIMQVVKHPLNTMEAYVAGHPWANTPVRQLASGVGKNIAGSVAEGALSPENALTLPYNMAAYEQAKIRANPNAPEYANNPYAMVQRGQAPTQGAAGAMNQQSAVQGMNTAGNPQPGTPQFAQLAQQYSGVAQPQTPPPASSTAAPPTSANFIGRMHELYDQYAHVKIPGLTQ